LFGLRGKSGRKEKDGNGIICGGMKVSLFSIHVCVKTYLM